VADPTPNPAVRIDLPPVPPRTGTEEAENAAIAAVVDALGRFAQPPYGDLQCSAGRAAVVAIVAAAPILLAAGRTAAAAELADLRERFAVLAEIEKYIGESCDNASHNIRDVLNGSDPRADAEHYGLDWRAAARVAENGADPQRPVERTAEVALDCGGCGDTIWPTEHVYEFGDGRVRCVICQVKSSGRGADQ